MTGAITLDTRTLAALVIAGVALTGGIVGLAALASWGSAGAMSERRMIVAVSAIAVGLLIVLALNVIVLLDVSAQTPAATNDIPTASAIAAQEAQQDRYVNTLIVQLRKALEQHNDASIRVAVHELEAEISLVCVKVKACG